MIYFDEERKTKKRGELHCYIGINDLLYILMSIVVMVMARKKREEKKWQNEESI